MSDTLDSNQVSHSPNGNADIFGRATNGKIGMWIFLVTDAMTFAGFLLGYGVLRARNPDWPHMADVVGIKGLVLSSIATFILICSSVTMVIAQAAGEIRDNKKMLNYLLLTALGGAIFLGIQAYEYSHLSHALGMLFSDYAKGPPQFSSIFYVVTGFHGLHVLSGVIYLLIMCSMVARGKYANGNVNHIEITGLFWHFVDLVWILVFTFIYLI